MAKAAAKSKQREFTIMSGGFRIDNNTTAKKGAKVKSDVDLEKLFPGVCLCSSKVPAVPVGTNPAAAPTQPETNEEGNNDPTGPTDVSSQFTNLPANVKVLQMPEGGYNVYDDDSGNPANKDPFGDIGAAAKFVAELTAG